MHRSVRLFLCVALIAMLPVRASALDIDWKYWERFFAEHGCDVAVMRAGKLLEGLEIAGFLGKQFGCPWAVKKILGPSPADKNDEKLVGGSVLGNEAWKKSILEQGNTGVMDLSGHIDLSGMDLSRVLPRQLGETCVSNLDCALGLRCEISENGTENGPSDLRRGTCVLSSVLIRKFCSRDSQCDASEQCQYQGKPVLSGGFGHCYPSSAPITGMSGEQGR